MGKNCNRESGCNGCHNLTVLCLDLSGIALFTVKEIDYDCIILDTSKWEAIHLLKKYVLNDRGYIQNACLIQLRDHIIWNFIVSGTLENFLLIPFLLYLDAIFCNKHSASMVFFNKSLIPTWLIAALNKQLLAHCRTRDHLK